MDTEVGGLETLVLPKQNDPSRCAVRIQEGFHSYSEGRGTRTGSSDSFPRLRGKVR